MAGRDENGKFSPGNPSRFAPGNPGGPGRPRRDVERDYLTVLNEAITLTDWRQIVERAVRDDKAGDTQARQWLAGYVIGTRPPSLLNLAAMECAGETVEDQIAEAAENVALLATLRSKLYPKRILMDVNAATAKDRSLALVLRTLRTVFPSLLTWENRAFLIEYLNKVSADPANSATNRTAADLLDW